MELLKTVQYRGYSIDLYQDEEPLHPRSDCDPLGKLYTEHRDYDFTDKGVEDPRNESKSGMRPEVAVWLPVYLMDHSGLSICTSAEPFRAFDPAGWDWGQIGVIYLTRKDIKDEFGWARLTKKRRETLENYLQDEIAELNDYLTGNVVGYVIMDSDGESHDSCWGFYPEHRNSKLGLDRFEIEFGYVIKEAQSIIDGYVAESDTLITAGIGL